MAPKAVPTVATAKAKQASGGKSSDSQRGKTSDSQRGKKKKAVKKSAKPATAVLGSVIEEIAMGDTPATVDAIQAAVEETAPAEVVVLQGALEAVEEAAAEASNKPDPAPYAGGINYASSPSKAPEVLLVGEVPVQEAAATRIEARARGNSIRQLLAAKQSAANEASEAHGGAPETKLPEVPPTTDSSMKVIISEDATASIIEGSTSQTAAASDAPAPPEVASVTETAPAADSLPADVTSEIVAAALAQTAAASDAPAPPEVASVKETAPVADSLPADVTSEIVPPAALVPPPPPPRLGW